MHHPPDRTLWVIAAFKLIKGLALLILGLGLLRYLHHDMAEALTHLLNKLRIDPEEKHAAALLAKAGLLNAKTLPWISGLTFAYAALFLTEGIGLSLQKRWAEWLTIVSTGSLIPFEAYELSTHPSLAKLILLAANLAIVVLLIWRIRRPTQPALIPPGSLSAPVAPPASLTPAS